jgi:hypothetical protein
MAGSAPAAGGCSLLPPPLPAAAAAPAHLAKLCPATVRTVPLLCLGEPAALLGCDRLSRAAAASSVGSGLGRSRALLLPPPSPGCGLAGLLLLLPPAAGWLLGLPCGCDRGKQAPVVASSSWSRPVLRLLLLAAASRA